MERADRKQVKATLLQALQAGTITSKQGEVLGLGSFKCIVRTAEEHEEQERAERLGLAVSSTCGRYEKDSAGCWHLDKEGRALLVDWLREIVKTGTTIGPASERAQGAFAGRLLVLVCKTREDVEKLQDMDKLADF